MQSPFYVALPRVNVLWGPHFVLFFQNHYQAFLLLKGWKCAVIEELSICILLIFRNLVRSKALWVVCVYVFSLSMVILFWLPEENTRTPAVAFFYFDSHSSGDYMFKAFKEHTSCFPSASLCCMEIFYCYESCNYTFLLLSLRQSQHICTGIYPSSLHTVDLGVSLVLHVAKHLVE